MGNTLHCVASIYTFNFLPTICQVFFLIQPTWQHWSQLTPQTHHTSIQWCIKVQCLPALIWFICWGNSAFCACAFMFRVRDSWAQHSAVYWIAAWITTKVLRLAQYTAQWPVARTMKPFELHSKKSTILRTRVNPVQMIPWFCQLKNLYILQKSASTLSDRFFSSYRYYLVVTQVEHALVDYIYAPVNGSTIECIMHACVLITTKMDTNVYNFWLDNVRNRVYRGLYYTQLLGGCKRSYFAILLYMAVLMNRIVEEVLMLYWSIPNKLQGFARWNWAHTYVIIWASLVLKVNCYTTTSHS